LKLAAAAAVPEPGNIAPGAVTEAEVQGHRPVARDRTEVQRVFPMREMLPVFSGEA
jgi:hypothetical protein